MNSDTRYGLNNPIKLIDNGDGTYSVATSLNGSLMNQNLADAVTTTGLKTTSQLSPGGYGTLRQNIYGTGAFSVQVQGQMADGTWYAIPGINATSTSPTMQTDITAAGIYDFDVAGFVYVALCVTSVTTNVSSKGALLV